MAPLERSQRVVAPTYPDSADTVAELVDGLAGMLEALGMTPALVIGYSLGGYLAQALAWRHPARVAGLVLLNTGGPAPSAARAVVVEQALLAALPEPALMIAARTAVGAQLRLEAPGLDAGSAAFWRKYMSAMARRVGKARMRAHQRLVVDFLRGPAGVTPLAEANPALATLIVSSARDRTIESAERRALDRLYPLAARVMEPNAGRLSVLTRPERYLAALETRFPVVRE
jgi:pimeloyl-ACP methyl ester carboxylesterase